MSLLATNYTPISIISLVSLIGGYGGLWLLWHFVFSPKQDHDDTADGINRAAALKAAAAGEDPPDGE
ncbi:MAG TPA: hypothetical protein VHW26_11310 [Solirubrobacteraceae bacterium]|nr:hypothetical protein [Solirubrobacteraceae bacterium]